MSEPFIKLPLSLYRQRGFSLRDKCLWAYIQAFPVFRASDAHIAKELGHSVGSVRNSLSKIRAATGAKGRDFPKSVTIPRCNQTMTKTSSNGDIGCNETMTDYIGLLDRGLDRLENKEGEKLPRMSRSLLDSKIRSLTAGIGIQ